MSTFEPGGVYWVESAEDPTVLLAINPRVTERGYVEWYDSVRDRIFPVVETRTDGEVIVVVSKKASFRFLPLTLERYRSQVRHRVQGALDFSDDESLRRFYLNAVE